MTETQPRPDHRLMELLTPVLAKVAELAPQDRSDPASQRALVEAMEVAFPYAGEHAQAIGAELATGVRDGWLCNRGEPNARFSRVAKPGPTTHGLSVDVVSLEGAAVEHTHPKGEVTLGFAAADAEGGDPRFDGYGPGWVFMAPGSRHTPTVTGRRMHLVYFLPDGAVEWHM